MYPYYECVTGLCFVNYVTRWNLSSLYKNHTSKI